MSSFCFIIKHLTKPVRCGENRIIYFSQCDVMMSYEWNPQKAKIHFKKHGILFEEAKTVFDDPFYLDFYDPEHSDDEHRYIIIGRLYSIIPIKR